MASVTITDADKRKIMRVLPEWLKPEPGFRFVDESGDTYIVLGFGGWREWETQGNVFLAEQKKHYQLAELNFKPPTLVGSMFYKGEFSIIDIVDLDGLDKCKPLQLGGD